MSRATSGRSLPAACLLALAVLTVTGCGGGDARSSAQGAGPGLGVPLRLADCEDWKKGSPDDRLAVLDDLKGFYGSPILSGKDAPKRRGSILGDRQAYGLMQRTCRPDYASSFLLYKLYGRVAGFAGKPAGAE